MVPGEVNPANLDEAGWGLVVPTGTPPAVFDALEPLLATRRAQAGARFRILNYLPDEDAKAFLTRHGSILAPVVDPATVPYYLLLVGDPTTIPFDLQAVLARYYAVGRLTFDTPEEYVHYANAVAARDATMESPVAAAMLFAPGAANQPALDGAEALIVDSLSKAVRKRVPAVQTLVGTLATRQALSRALIGNRDETERERPDLLVTVTQSLIFPPGHERQNAEQGSLLCAHSGTAAEPGAALGDRVFSAADIPDEADFRGLIAVHVGSFCAGTGRLDSLAVQAFREELLLAPEPFVAGLPRRVLGHERPALAVIGQTDRLTLCGPAHERWSKLGAVLRDLLARLVRGDRVGHAFSHTSLGWAPASSELAGSLADVAYGSAPVNNLQIASSWAHKELLRSLVVLGDPAVRFGESTV